MRQFNDGDVTMPLKQYNDMVQAMVTDGSMIERKAKAMGNAIEDIKKITGSSPTPDPYIGGVQAIIRKLSETLYKM